MINVAWYFEGDTLRVRLASSPAESVVDVRDFISGPDGLLEDFENDFDYEKSLREFTLAQEFWDDDNGDYCWDAFDAAHDHIEKSAEWGEYMAGLLAR